MKFFLKILIASALLVLIAGTSAYLTLTLLIKSEDAVVVPELTGKDAIYALEVLTDLGLNIKVKAFEYNADIPKNHVVFQDPEAGSEIKKGRDVRLVLSKGSKTLLVPELIGLDIRQAKIIIDENDLKSGNIARVFNEQASLDEVLAQTPGPRETIARGSAVNLLVSRGHKPKAFAMPSFEGLSLDDAILLLERDQLILGKIQSTWREEMPEGIVVSQEPADGYRVMEGTRVNLTINRMGAKLPTPRGAYLFRYRLPDGFLKKHIKVIMNIQGFSYSCYDTFIKPGKELRLLVPPVADMTLLLYEDKELILKKVF
jgi:serine/threonine-protein kinase